MIVSRQDELSKRVRLNGMAYLNAARPLTTP